MIHGVLDVRVIEAERDPQSGKVFLRIFAPDGNQMDVTLNVAVAIGSIARGTIERFGYDKVRP